MGRLFVGCPACRPGKPICVRSGSPRAIAFGHIVDVPAAAGAFGTGTAWVQLIIVASIVATLRINGDKSEEHTSELQSLMRISYAVFCLKKKNTKKRNNKHT